MNNIISIIALAMAAIIGAGFSSGKEIYIFFNNTENYGILNIILSVIVFYATFYYLFKIIDKYDIRNYKQLVTVIANNKISNIIEKVISLFILIIFWIMIAGFGAFLAQIFNIPTIVGSILLSIASYISFKFNMKGIIRISKYLIPLIILSIIILFFNTDIQTDINTNNSNISIIKGMTSGIIYASYNLVIAIPIMINIRDMIRNKKERIISSLGISIILAILIFFIFFLNNTYLLSISSLDMPLLFIAESQNLFIYFFYNLMICFAIYTTAISSGYTVISKYETKPKLFKFISFLICIIGILVSNINFSILIEYCFSYIGYIGIIEIGLIIYTANIKKNKSIQQQ